MKTIELTEEQYKALMENGEIVLKTPVKKWEPEGGEWTVDWSGDIRELETEQECAKFGTEYPTKERAEKARDAMRTHNRLLAWLDENDDGWVADWGIDEEKFSVCYNHSNKKWDVWGNEFAQYVGEVYMSKNNAEKLADLLNKGIVEL